MFAKKSLFSLGYSGLLHNCCAHTLCTFHNDPSFHLLRGTFTMAQGNQVPFDHRMDEDEYYYDDDEGGEYDEQEGEYQDDGEEGEEGGDIEIGEEIELVGLLKYTSL